MVAIIIACIFVIFFLLILPHLVYGVISIFESLFCFTLSAVFSVMILTILLLTVFALIIVVKFLFKKVKTVK